MKYNLLSTMVAAMLVLCAGSSWADDIDIYYNTGGSVDVSQPIVMFSLDWRPNLGSAACKGTECDFLKTELDSNGNPFLPAKASYTYFDMLRAVLRKVMDPLTGLRVGLMLNHDYKNNCAGQVKNGCSNGGYIGLRARSFREDDSNGAKAAFHKFLDNIPLPQGNASHKYQGKELFFEMFRYLTGQTILNGHVGYLDYASNTTKNLNVDNPLISWDTSAESGTKYISPLTAGGKCTKIFTVNIMFLVSQQDSDSDSYLTQSKALGGFGGSSYKEFPDVIRYLNDADLANGTYGTAANIDGVQNVTSYFLVDSTKINTTTRGYAQAGGTGEPLPLTDDPRLLVQQLQDVFKQILSVSTTFVSASVPVNAFNRAEVIDNVYLALFQADADAKPFWPGNVKKLKFAEVNDGSGNRVLVDALDSYAVAADGRIKYDALTYWTNSAKLPPADTDDNEVTGRDGRAVKRGGAGQKIPGMIAGSIGDVNASGTRQLFYDNGSSLAPLNADNATATALMTSIGVATSAEALVNLKYARGQDVNDEDSDGNLTEARGWLLGDPLHSRPLPINYGAVSGYGEDNQSIYIAFGANDGFLHFVRNTTSGSTGNESGEEIWAFMPQEVMNKLPKLKSNAAGIGKPYLVDGAPSVYVEGRFVDQAIDGDDVHLYFGLGRGGKAYYAIDISDPEDPALLWKITKSGDYSELAYTTSNPVVGLRRDGADTKPIVIFGGGYDLNKDARLGTPGTNDSEGAALYVADGKTGQLLWKAVGSGSSSSKVFVQSGLTDSIASAVAALDSDGDGMTDRVYVGDTGGRVWRADIGSANTADWKLTLLADIGRHYSSTKANDRRFFHAPDVVLHKDAIGPFDGVVIGSGDRSDPLDKGGVVSNFVYLIKDRNVAAGGGTNTGLTHASFGDVTNTCLEVGGECTATLTYGWRMGLTATGEKSLATPLSVGGTTYFTSYLPPGTSSSGSCGPDEGSGRAYAVKLDNAAAVRNYDSTTESLERYDELESKGIPAEAISLPPDGILKPDLSIEKTDVPTRLRTYWLESEDGAL